MGILSKSLLLALLALCYVIILPTVFCIGFMDVTENADVSGTGIGNGVAFIDYDNDGKPDLYVSSDPNDILYHNNGDGTFTDATEDVGISFLGDGVGIAFGDYDNDGDSDIYIPVNDGPDVFFQNIGGKIFRDVTRNVKIDNLARTRSADFADFDKDGFLDIYVVNEGSPNILYRNLNGKFFDDVSLAMDVAHTGPGRCCAWGDYDNDGDPDLYVTYKGAPNVLYRNDGNGFKDVTKIAGVEGSGNSTGTAFADYNNDGYLDICVCGNSWVYMYHNNHDGTFTDVSEKAGLTYSGENCTPSFGDYDNDGYLDLYLAVWKGKSLIYRNNGDGTFNDVTDELGLSASGNSWSAIWGDYNLDGNLDIYTSYTTRSNVLYENTGSANNWLKVKVRGSLSNRDSIGARLKLSSNGITQIREVSGGSGYGSQNSLIAEFGLGEYIRADMLEVTWSSGISVRLKNIQANRLIVIEENVSAVETSDERSPSSGVKENLPNTSRLLSNYPNPFNPETWIPYQIAWQSDVVIRILNSTGCLVRILRLGVKNPGYYLSQINAAYWDGKNEDGEIVAGGVYFCLLKTSDTTDIKKMILRK